ncbi:unnamed protein product [Porites lobata]|uniref:Uncharacterized protein n=1 Tax=Porites lobata TaxID=104759 RepID=A0ABN8NGI4_9CNID|nr:unnamed protein product [Porites lobata]
MATVLRDSGELIQCLENIEPLANCLLVGVDVSSLYPNNDPKKMSDLWIDCILDEGNHSTSLQIKLKRKTRRNKLKAKNEEAVGDNQRLEKKPNGVHPKSRSPGRLRGTTSAVAQSRES